MRSITLHYVKSIPVQVRMLTAERFRAEFPEEPGEEVGGTFGNCATIEHEDMDTGKCSMRIEITIAADRMGAGAFVHELGHACFSICRFLHAAEFPSNFFTKSFVDVDDTSGLGPDECPEERFCYMISNLTAEFWTIFYKREYDKLPLFNV